MEELPLPANLCAPTRFDPKALSALANGMRRIAEPCSAARSCKICISRKDSKGGVTPGRDFANLETYERRMRRMGCRVVEISMISPEDQLALRVDATGIVGIHGAGMMNMIMMPTGGNCTEISGAPAVPEPELFCPDRIERCATVAGHRPIGLTGMLDRNRLPMINLER